MTFCDLKFKTFWCSNFGKLFICCSVEFKVKEKPIKSFLAIFLGLAHLFHILTLLIWQFV